MSITVPHHNRMFTLPKLDNYDNIKLDIGSGEKQMKKKEGYIGLDIEPLGQEIVWDVDCGIPLPSNSCTNIFMHHVLEHVKDPIFVMNECNRVLQRNGEIEVIVPYYKEAEAYVLHHTHFFSEDTFKHLCIHGLEKRYGIRQWHNLEISVGDPKWVSDFKQPTVYARLSPAK